MTRARPFDPYPTLIRGALLVGLLPGFGLGLCLLVAMAFQWEIGPIWLPLVQAHGHAQVFGFTALFVFGVGTQILPRFLSVPPARPRQVQLAGILVGVGVGVRFLLQPLGPGSARNGGLMLAAALELVGATLFATAMGELAQKSVQPRASWQDWVRLGLASLTLGYVLNLAASLSLAGGRTVVSPALEEGLLHLGIWGFIVPTTLAVGMKIFPQFLILRPARAQAFRPALIAYGAGVGLIAAAWLGQEWRPELFAAASWMRLAGWLTQAAAVLACVGALRVYEPAARESGLPHISNPTRLWFRLAFAWLLLAVALGLAYAIREVAAGAPANFVEASAQRHALTMGYLLPLLVGMAGRILPGFSGQMTRQPRVLAALVWLLLTGALLRVGGELLGGYAGPGRILMALGASLAFGAFAWFAWLLWPTLGRRPGAAPSP
ncbi:MAG TPA: NnrS family protein [Chloroflexota bacterium]|nr:NnrS family protein [Chloroflexota bacterium]